MRRCGGDVVVWRCGDVAMWGCGVGGVMGCDGVLGKLVTTPSRDEREPVLSGAKTVPFAIYYALSVA
jgi:hypothetical protein